MDLGDIGDLLGKNTAVDKIGDVVEFFMEHRDDFDKVIAFVQSAPAMLDKLAGGLNDAGTQARQASLSLVGSTGKAGAAGALATGAGTLASVGEQIAKAADLIGDVAGFMAKVNVPSVEPKYSSVAGIKVMSGLDFGSDAILADPAARLADTAASLTEAHRNLNSLGDNLDDLAGFLTKVGAALDKLGEHLEGTGNNAAKLFG